MEQKDYKMEIINELLRDDNHIRSMAKNINTNHMNIIRRIKELSKENVVDYKEFGKNKTYFLSAENYKLNRILKKYPELRSIIEKIQNDKRIRLAILFGSYAKGLVKQDSDIDIFIETNNKKIKNDISLIDLKLSIKIGKYNKSNLLIKEIEKNHVIIKGVEYYYERNQFFKEN